MYGLDNSAFGRAEETMTKVIYGRFLGRNHVGIIRNLGRPSTSHHMVITDWNFCSVRHSCGVEY